MKRFPILLAILLACASTANALTFAAGDYPTVMLKMIKVADGTGATGIAPKDLTYAYTIIVPSSKTRTAVAGKAALTALATTATDWTSAYGIEMDATNQPGVYRVDFPQLAVATAGTQVLFTLLYADEKTAYCAGIYADVTPPVNATQWGGAALPTSFEADLTKIHGEALTETSKQLAGRFVNFFDQDTATFNVKSNVALVGSNMGTTTSLTGDAYAALTGGAIALSVKSLAFGTAPKVDFVDAPNGTAITAIQKGLSTLTTGAQMDLVDAPNAKAVTAIQKGLSTFDPATTKVTASLCDKTTLTDSVAATGLDLILSSSTFSKAIGAAVLAAVSSDGKVLAQPDNTRPTNFLDLAIAKTAGTVTFGNTIPSFLLAADVPPNFKALSITATTGLVNVGGLFGTTFAAEGTAGNYAGSFGKLFNVKAADTNLTMASFSLTGDAFARIGAPVSLDGGGTTIAAMLAKMADDNVAPGTEFKSATDSLHGLAGTFPSNFAKTVIGADGYVGGNVIQWSGNGINQAVAGYVQVDVHLWEGKGIAAVDKTGNVPAFAADAGASLTTIADTRMALLDAKVSGCLTPAGIMGVQTTCGKLDSTFEADGAAYRFTAKSLVNAPTGGTGLTKQETRDSMALALTGGTPTPATGLDGRIIAIPTATYTVPTADQNAVALLAKTTVTVGGTLTVAQVLNRIYAGQVGKVVRTGTSYAYYDTDGTTPLFTLTIVDPNRTTK